MHTQNHRSDKIIVLITLILLIAVSTSWVQGAQDLSFTKYAGNPVLDFGPSGQLDDTHVLGPSVLKMDNVYKMWYSGHDGSVNRIFYATSNDGITWTKYSPTPVLDLGESGQWDDVEVGHASVLYDDGTYKMWYMGSQGGTLHQFGYATSSDGINWTRYAGNPVLNPGPDAWDNAAVQAPMVIKDGTTYKMWYTGYTPGTLYQIGYATSPDGINWTKHSGPVLQRGSEGEWDATTLDSPDIVKVDNLYYAFYTARAAPGAPSQIGYATSSDGINWTKYLNNPILVPGASDTWDDLEVSASSVLYTDGIYKIWYTGHDGLHERIGYAYSPLPIIDVSPIALDFGEVVVGQTSSMTVTVSNTGTATLNVSDVNITGPDAGEFSVNTSFSVNPSESHEMTVTFAPMLTGNKNASLNITHNAEGSPTVIPLSGIGAPATPVLSLDPTSVSFGNIHINQTASQTLRVSNIGMATLSVSDISITGPDAGEFSVNTSFSVDPGGFHDVTVTFAPTSIGEKHATLRLTHNAAGSPTDVPLTGMGIKVTLKFTNGFGKPGGPGVVAVFLDTSIPIAGVQFRVHPNPDTHVRFNGILNALQDEGFTVSDATNPDGVTTVLLFSTSGVQIPPGETLLMQLVYDIDQAAPNGAEIDLMVSDNILSNPFSHEVPHTVQSAKIYVGLPGDVAGGPLNFGDGSINILDIIKLVNYILSIFPPPEPFTFSFFVADINGDGSLDILDIVAMVNAILYNDGQPKVLADGPSGPVMVDLEDVQALESGQLVVPVTVTTNGVIAGVQATFTFDAAQLKPGTPQVVGRASGMTVQSQAKDGRLQVVVYSASGQGIPAGSGPTLLVPVTVLGGPEASASLTLAQVLLANRQAQAIPVVLGTSTVKVQPLPTAFTLKPARPNPFNPTTQIAYEVPRSAQVALVVYNVLGQEVVRLVDEVKMPGRYVVTWDGRNGQGGSVASGVYLYRLTTSTGFSQTRRMTLVK